MAGPHLFQNAGRRSGDTDAVEPERTLPSLRGVLNAILRCSGQSLLQKESQ